MKNPLRRNGPGGSGPGSGKQQMSFLPEDYVEKRVERRTNIICLSLFVIVIAGVVGAWWVSEQKLAAAVERRREVQRAKAQAAEHLEQLDELRQQKQQMLRKAQVTATLVEPVPRSFLLADLVNRMPETLSLFEFELHSKEIQVRRSRRIQTALGRKKSDDEDGEDEPAPPPVPEMRVSLAMEGVAPTDVQVAQYMSTLAQSDLLEDVNLIFSEQTEVEGSTMRRFRIEMEIAPEADVRQISPEEAPDRLKDNPLRDRTSVTVPGGSDDEASNGGFEKVIRSLTGDSDDSEKENER